MRRWIHSSSWIVLGIDDTPGADGCMTESSLNDEFVIRSEDPNKADSVGVYEEIT
jgi:hypothetical protein